MLNITKSLKKIIFGFLLILFGLLVTILFLFLHNSFGNKFNELYLVLIIISILFLLLGSIVCVAETIIFMVDYVRNRTDVPLLYQEGDVVVITQ